MPLKIQKHPLQHEQRYILDGAVELGMLDAGSADLIALYADRAVFDRVAADTRWQEMHLALFGMASEIFEQAPREIQESAISAGLLHARFQARATASMLASWAIQDIVEGGCMHPWRPAPRAQKDKCTPLIRDFKRLRSPQWIRRHVRFSSEARYRKNEACRILARCKIPPTREMIRSGHEHLHRLMVEQADRQTAAQSRLQSDLDQARAGGIPLSDAIQNRKKLRVGVSRYRKVTKKAAVTAAAIVGTPAVSAFTRGDPVVFAGKEVDFRIKRQGTFSRQGVHGVSVSVLNKSEEKLADLCLYFENTPALDQMTAIKLHVEAGMEEDLIRDANVFGVTDQGLAHPLFEQREKKSANYEELDRQAFALLSGLPPTSRYASQEERRARDQAYWQETRHVWLAATETHVFGRTVKLFDPPNELDFPE